jgi:anti-sigma B factor antagonist
VASASGTQTEQSDAFAGHLRIAITVQDTTTTVALEGEWDLIERESMRHAIASALADRPERFVLDLRHLSFMDSTGVHGTIELARHAARQEIELVIVPGPRAVQRVFEICELTARLPFVSDL